MDTNNLNNLFKKILVKVLKNNYHNINNITWEI